MSAVYDAARAAFLAGGLNLGSDTIKAALVKTSYTPNYGTHQYLSDLGANTTGTDQTLGAKTMVAGVFDAADIAFSSVPASTAIGYLVLYKDTGSAATSPLICGIDASLTTGGSVSTINVTWDNSANRIFKL
ncbi:bacteriophage protein [Capsulimonas corticalis]|uniref:Bacteriophage protein n=1 Tax=Capsulimonas corticalis TaxID=2219043 RepID=A0A402CNN1_9BACT|nr:hypothetical protein [Capsulimonas corticalis]BDI33336.1 bacteriophage protein [Capsulimonas corticalis]